MANVTYTVKKGDTLSEIAAQYGTTVAKLVELNHIKNPDYIVVGQVLIISGSAATVKANKSSKANITVFGMQSNTDRTMYATWTWDKDNTENYQVIWYYDTGDKVWFVGSDSTEKYKQSLYTAPTNAKRVKFKVKPISKKKKVNNKETSYWTAQWSSQKTYDFKDAAPETPATPSVKIEKYKLTATLDNIESNTTRIQFQVVKNNSTVYKTGTANVKTAHASFSCTVESGAEYKVRCRGYNGTKASGWSAYSTNAYTIPATPIGFNVCKATSESSVLLEWTADKTATSYDIQYTTNVEYYRWDSDQVQSITGIESTTYEKSGLETGEQYYFRLRAVNSAGEGNWSAARLIVLGKKPIAPTTWSSATTITVGDILKLYWVHNAEDESSQTYGELELNIDGTVETHTIKNSTVEEEKDKTSVYEIDTSEYSEGAQIKWRVRTAGVTKEYGDWSIQRTVDIYAPPTLELGMVDVSGELVETLESFPVYVSALAGPNTQAPIGYHLSIKSNEIYETVDNVGNTKTVNEGEEVYSKHFDITDPLMVELSANNVDLENNISYTLTCVVTMNSGLTTESSLEFTVSWVDLEYEPNAEISIDEETLMAYICPYCEDTEGTYLSVYRREYDGEFTEIASGLDSDGYTFVTDPHPSLDFARYRIVAVSKTTGAVSYCDLPGIPMSENAVVIQWDEEWTNFETDNEDEMEKPAWSGSMLKLPYNIDISDSNTSDVSLIEYIGRKRPVSYYGTQLGETSTWNVVIPKEDKETLYALRRLMIWMGDVYVREPSGSGYWANIKVSFSQKHRDVTIPVTLNVTRVEGGM